MKEEKSKSPNIYQRINAVMNDVSYIQKESKKVNNMYTFVSHDQVSSTLHPALVKHGIVIITDCESIVQNGNRCEVLMIYRFVNCDDPNDSFQIRIPGHGIDPSDKGIGKAISYSYKYMLLKMFCLETGDDNERSNTNYEEDKISLEEAEEIAFLCEGNDELLQKILKKCPKGQLINLQKSRFDALKNWLQKELEKSNA